MSSRFSVHVPAEEMPMRLFSTLFFLLSVISIAAAQDQQLAHIGDFKVESGEVIRNCVLGYRAFGTLNPQKSNVVVFPTFLGGRSADLAGRIGAGKLVDR